MGRGEWDFFQPDGGLTHGVSVQSVRFTGEPDESPK